MPVPLLNKPYQRFHKMNHKNFKKKNTGHKFRAINILINCVDSALGLLYGWKCPVPMLSGLWNICTGLKQTPY